jgi:hypothetical protein
MLGSLGDSKPLTANETLECSRHTKKTWPAKYSKSNMAVMQ